MAFTYGFYNSLNHDRKYDAIQISSLFDGILLDGVYMTIGNQFTIQEIEGESNSVIVRAGRAWFNHTWNYNDSDFLLEGPESDLVLDRIDAIVIDIDSSTRTNTVKWVTGVPSSTPQNPIMIHTTDHNQYALAYLYRAANSSLITQGNITNAVGTSETPFVTGVLQGMNIDNLITQWEAQWTEFYNSQTEAMEDQTEYWAQQWETWYLNFTLTKSGTFNDWMDEQKNDFNAWYANLQDILDENVAANLAQQIGMLDTRVTSLENFRDNLKYEYSLLYTIDDASGNPILDDGGGVIEGALIIMLK